MLRTARSTDAAAIAALHAASWRFAYRAALSEEYLAGDIVEDRIHLWQQRLEQPAAEQCVVVAGNESLKGFACLYLNDDPEWGSLLDNIHVRETSLRESIGTALLLEVARRAAELAPKAGLYLWVLQSNLRARRFYEFHGAANVGEDVWNAPGGTFVPRFRYAWPAGRLPLKADSRLA